MLIYELITYVIILLGKLRDAYLLRFHWKDGFVIRKDRDELNLIPGAEKRLKKPYHGFLLECCDCGLSHNLTLDEKGDMHLLPQRPMDYKYRLR